MEIVRAVTGVHVEVDDPLDPVSVPVHLVAGAAHVQAHVLAAEVAEAEHRPRGVLAQQKLLLRVPKQGRGSGYYNGAFCQSSLVLQTNNWPY